MIQAPFFVASLTSFCRLSQGGCAYQYFVGTSGVTFTSEGTVVELMSVGECEIYLENCK